MEVSAKWSWDLRKNFSWTKRSIVFSSIDIKWSQDIVSRREIENRTRVELLQEYLHLLGEARLDWLAIRIKRKIDLPCKGGNKVLKMIKGNF